MEAASPGLAGSTAAERKRKPGQMMDGEDPDPERDDWDGNSSLSLLN